MAGLPYKKLLSNLASSSRTREYWPSVIFVRAVRAATTSGQYYIKLLLTEREVRTGEYWPEAVTVRTSLRSVRTKKTTEGQYSPVRLELARLESSLLYGTQLMRYIFFLSNALPVS